MRFWEIDFFRGIAVVLMVLFNWSFALYYLQILTVVDDVFFWFWFPRIVASMFIFIAGISMTVSYAKNNHWKRHAKRGAKLLILGIAITAVTYALFPKDFIIFGILHFIGAATLVSLFFMKKKDVIPLAALIIFATGLLLQEMTFDFPYLVWLGLVPSGFSTLDYFPLLPWLGVFLAGTVAGDYLYKKEKRQFKISPEKTPAKPFILLGRHSLLIYIVHQPLLIVILFVLGIL